MVLLLGDQAILIMIRTDAIGADAIGGLDAMTLSALANAEFDRLNLASITDIVELRQLISNARADQGNPPVDMAADDRSDDWAYSVGYTIEALEFRLAQLS